MNTVTEASHGNPPLGLKLSEGLGPWPERDMVRVPPMLCKPHRVPECPQCMKGQTMAGKCEHGLTTAECFVCASPKYGLYPHHCEPGDVAALVRRLEALADPAQEPIPSYADTDWRTLAGVAARVIKYLRGDDWRHGA